MRPKIFLLFLIFITSFQESYAQHHYSKLKQADSLFHSKKYNSALKIYQEIYNRDQQYSPQMLLRMAYIKESTDDYTAALYFLNQYYDFHPEKKVLKKMEELAAKYRLEGYRYTDLEYFVSIYNQYYYYIIFILLVAVLLFYFYLILKKLLKRRLGLRPLMFVIILGAAYYLTNYNIIPVQAIIKNNNAYLMTAPSAGADFVAAIDQGHRVTILGKQDIWYEINWQDKPVFIREDNLLVIGQ